MYEDEGRERCVDKNLIKSLGGGGGRRVIDTDDDTGGGLAEGVKVEAKYRGGSRYYNGKITRTRLNGTFDILYVDGEKEMGVDKNLIKSLGGGGGGGGGGGEDTHDDNGAEVAKGVKKYARHRRDYRYTTYQASPTDHQHDLQLLYNT